MICFHECLMKKKRDPLNVLESDPSVYKDLAMQEMKRMYGDHSATEKLQEVIADHLNGTFKLTDENIERMLDAYRELFKLAK